MIITPFAKPLIARSSKTYGELHADHNSPVNQNGARENGSGANAQDGDDDEGDESDDASRSEHARDRCGTHELFTSRESVALLQQLAADYCG